MSGAVAEVVEDPVLRDRPPSRHERRRMRPREAVLWLLLAPVLLIGARAFVAEPFKIPSTSMVPTLAVGDHVLVNKLAYTIGSPQPGDIAVLRSPSDGTLLIKRVVGLGGQRVEIRDGVLFVDRRPVRESYVDYDMVDGFYFGPYRVPEGDVFVLGDDRGDSKDSRDFGPVSERELVGRADWRLAPLDRIGPL